MRFLGGQVPVVHRERDVAAFDETLEILLLEHLRVGEFSAIHAAQQRSGRTEMRPPRDDISLKSAIAAAVVIAAALGLPLAITAMAFLLLPAAVTIPITVLVLWHSPAFPLRRPQIVETLHQRTAPLAAPSPNADQTLHVG